MSKEIERKFLVTQSIAGLIGDCTCVSIRQGYITPNPDGQQIRIRSKGDQYFLTAKGKGGLVREETEIELSQQQFEPLWPLTEGRRIAKTRYEIPYKQYLVELDVFEDALAGLVVAEIEFASVEDSKNIIVPEWFNRELTDDYRFTNSQLAWSQSIPELI